MMDFYGLLSDGQFFGPCGSIDEVYAQWHRKLSRFGRSSPTIVRVVTSSERRRYR